jgi:hypothetical protein
MLALCPKMETLRIRFPFKINDRDVETDFKMAVERREDIVSFGLEYDLRIRVEGAELKSREENEGKFIYVYKFRDLDSAMAFMEEPVAEALDEQEDPDIEGLEREMDEFMAAYELGESKKRKMKGKRTMVTDEDGFMKYV